MELNHLKTFIVVAEEKNVTRAAERLYMTPSSVSAHVKALEDELNIILFVRKPQGMEITDHGNVLRARAESLVRGAQDMVELSAKLQASLIGKVRIGLNTGFKFLRIAELITRVRQSYPKVDLVFESTSTGITFSSLRERTLDAGFIFGDAPDKFITTHGLYTAELVVAAPVAWQSQIARASWNDMALLPWVYPTAYCPFHSIVDKTFKREHISYQQAVTSDDDTTKLELVSAGIGLALLERTEAEEAAQEGKIAVWQRRLFKCELSWAYLKNRGEDPLINALTEDVLRVWEENRGQD
jgi:DNA-binding transcriptional LysR family regulator